MTQEGYAKGYAKNIIKANKRFRYEISIGSIKDKHLDYDSNCWLKLKLYQNILSP